MHNIIPHHHHDMISIDEDPQFEHQSKDQHSHAHAHHDEGHHSHHHSEKPKDDKSSSDNNNSEFPQHFHLFAEGDFKFTRVSTESQVFKAGQNAMVLILHIISDNSNEQPEMKYSVLKFPWLIHNDYEPASFLLRAPPCFA
jgi:hypothetical protein